MSDGPRVARSIALEAAELIYQAIEPLVERSAIAGSLRRGSKTCGDVDIIAIPRVGVSESEILVALDSVCDGGRLDDPTNAWHAGFVRVGESLVPFGVFLTDSESWGACFLYATGSRDFNRRYRGLAKSRGLSVDETGVYRKGIRISGSGRSERAMCAAIGMVWLPPEARISAKKVVPIYRPSDVRRKY